MTQSFSWPAGSTIGEIVDELERATGMRMADVVRVVHEERGYERERDALPHEPPWVDEDGMDLRPGAELRYAVSVAARGVYPDDLPRFVQRRAYELGVWPAPRIVVDLDRRFGAPTIEGTRTSPEDLAADLQDRSVEEVARDYRLTEEQVLAAQD